MKRLAFLVEGQSEVKSMPALVGKILNALPEELKYVLYTDDPPIRVGGLEGFTGKNAGKFEGYMKTAIGRSNLGGVLAVLDGDSDLFESKPFCPMLVGRTLALRARQFGAGEIFSFAAILLQQEYESFLIASAQQFERFVKGTVIPPSLEQAPRDAKRWLKQNLEGGYKEAVQQVELTHEVKDWTAARQLRSFQRLENAVRQLAEAVRDDRHVATPAEPVGTTPAEA